MILSGDVGGTKTLLALFTKQGDRFSCCKKEYYVSANYQTFNDLLTDFLAGTDNEITAVCIGVAGAIVNGECKTTNLPWFLSSAEISRQLDTENVYLLNDLEATAWGLLDLPQENFVELNPLAQPGQGNRAVVAAGTGLGEAIISWDGIKHHVIATEGGHTDFAPTSDQEIALLRYLMAKHPEHVSYERLVSGEGLVNIYQFLKQGNFAPVQSSIEQQMSFGDPAAIIGEAGVARSDALCVEALTLFCKLYGAEAGNLVLKCLAYSGIYLAGGIAVKILPFLEQGVFMQAFFAKGRFHSMLQKISVKVCTNPEVGLSGALSYAVKMIGNKD